MLVEIKGKRVEFEHPIKQTYRRLKTRFFHWRVTERQHLEYLNFVEKFRCTHSRYRRFPDYGEVAAYEAKLEACRVALGRRQ